MSSVFVLSCHCYMGKYVPVAVDMRGDGRSKLDSYCLTLPPEQQAVFSSRAVLGNHAVMTDIGATSRCLRITMPGMSKSPCVGHGGST